MEADVLVKAASRGGVMDVYDRIQYMPSIDLPNMQQIRGGENWMILIVLYLKDRRLLENKDKARNFPHTIYRESCAQDEQNRFKVDDKIYYSIIFF